MPFSCPACGYAAEKLTSFGGKFCPQCGERLVEALAAETVVAKKRLLSMEAVIATFREMADEPLSKRWQLKLALVTLALVIVQAIGYASYQIIMPLVTPAVVGGDSSPEITALFEKGAAAEADGKFAEAATHLNAILAREPENTKALNALGYLASIQHDTTTARGYYERVIAIDATDPLATQNLGVIAKEAGDAETAAAYFATTLGRDPANTTVKYLLAEIEMTTHNNPTEAERLLREVLATLPNHKKANLLLIETLRTRGATSELAEAITAAKVVLPNDADIQALH